MTSSAHRHGAGILPILAAIKLGQSCELLPLINSCYRIYDSLEAPSMARGSRYYHHSFYSVFLKSIWYNFINVPCNLQNNSPVSHVNKGMKKRMYVYMCLLCCSLQTVMAAGCHHDNNTTTQPPTTTPVQAKTYNYLALGDSYTIGQSIDSAGRYPAQTAAMLDNDSTAIPAIHYIATTGWTTANLQYAIANEHLADTFNIVTMLIGVNDQYQGVDTGTYHTHFVQLMQTAIQLAGGNKQHVIIISIPDYGVTPFGGGNAAISAQIDEFNGVNRRITDSFGVAYADVTTLSRAAASDPTLLANDGLHYSPKEYALWAQVIAPLIYQAIK